MFRRSMRLLNQIQEQSLRICDGSYKQVSLVPPSEEAVTRLVGGMDVSPVYEGVAKDLGYRSKKGNLVTKRVAIYLLVKHMSRGGQNNMRPARIRAFPQSVDSQFVDGIWNMLQTALNEILNKNNSGLSFEELYRNAYTLVLHKRGDKLYDGLQNVVGNHMRDKIRNQVEAAINGGFLDTLKRLWDDHTTAMIMIRDILMYMDRVYVTAQSNLETVYNLGLRIFREHIIDHPQINSTLQATLLNMVAAERNKESIEWINLKTTIQMLIILGFESRLYYEEQFESHFLEESREYYQKLADEFLKSNSAPIYVDKVNECLADEKRRADRYLDKITEDKILDVVKSELIEKHLETIVKMQNSGMTVMLNNSKIGDLRKLYDMAKLIPRGIRCLTEHMSVYLRERGRTLVETQNNVSPLELIKNLLELKNQFDHFLDQSFSNDKDFKRTIQDDFTYFFNLNTKNAEYLAIFIDDNLKKGRKALSDREIETNLDKAMVLFKFLEDKDVFERYYKQHLAKRLLFDRSASDDQERSMIGKLKSECGCQFTSKLQRMLNDVSLKAELTNTFRDTVDSQNCIDMTAMVLTSNVWPMSSNTTFEVAPELKNSMDKFANFYQLRHNGRRLAYLLVSSRGEVVANCFSKKYAFVATVAQMSILNMFNTSTPEIAQTALQAIIKTEILIFTQGENLESANATLAINNDFKNKKFKVDLTKMTGKSEVRKENEQVQQEIDDDRRHVIQAAIVRIMKTRKVLKHAQLVSEVLSQLASRFKPTVLNIKKAIDTLIEREYLKRQEDNYESLEYIA
ncbi:CULLIN-2 domain-containing protein [Aphelenchoides bicaudatus]|nr:CULLIN-2 domain-containing protein [Aphelenchoides bicaudatus]